jgi:hypothetical protein
MHRIAIVVVVCAIVAACAAQIEKGMNSLQGQPLSAAIAKLGVPSEEQTIAGQKVYIWRASSLNGGTERRAGPGNLHRTISGVSA